MEPTSNSGHVRAGKSREAFRTISEVAEMLDLPQHVLRFWESKFSQIKPLKRGGNRRYYRPDDVTLLTAIKKLLHTDGYTIRGVQKLFKAQGIKATILLALDESGASSLAASMNQAHEKVEATVPAALSPAKGVADSNEQFKNILNQLKNIRSQLG